MVEVSQIIEVLKKMEAEEQDEKRRIALRLVANFLEELMNQEPLKVKYAIRVNRRVEVMAETSNMMIIKRARA